MSNGHKWVVPKGAFSNPKKDWGQNTGDKNVLHIEICTQKLLPSYREGV